MNSSKRYSNSRRWFVSNSSIVNCLQMSDIRSEGTLSRISQISLCTHPSFLSQVANEVQGVLLIAVGSLDVLPKRIVVLFHDLKRPFWRRFQAPFRNAGESPLSCGFATGGGCS
jgi:hypothetical protein